MKKFDNNKCLKKSSVYMIVSCLFIEIFGLYIYLQANLKHTKTDLILNDVIGVYVDGEYASTIPGKDAGYVVDKVVCDNDAIGEWNNDKWGLLTTNMTKKSKCNVYFIEKLVNKVTNLSKKDTTNIVTDDPDSNIRYIGANPNNYIYFNCSDYNNQSDSTCEKWRIIGVFNNVTKSDGTKENLVKIIRDDRLNDTTIGWDYKQSGLGTSTSSYGSNDWTDSQLMMMLNPTTYLKSGYTNSNDIISSGSQQLYAKMGSYYNGTKGCLPASVTSGSSFSCTEVDFTSLGLKNDTTRNAIEEVMWNLGGVNPSSWYPSEFYSSERGTTVYSGHATTWIGKIGLMYPSDYGYATAGSSSATRATCLATSMLGWNASEVTDCKNNNYLYKSSYTQWTLAPYLGNTDVVFFVTSTGYVLRNVAGNIGGVRPALYLKSSISVVDGNGTSLNPYKLEM